MDDLLPPERKYGYLHGKVRIEELWTCPYDPSHRVSMKKIRPHLVECAKKHPNSTLISCPYNATHRYEQMELVEHVKKCPSAQRQNGLALAASRISRPPPNIQKVKPVIPNPDDEIW